MKKLVSIAIFASLIACQQTKQENQTNMNQPEITRDSTHMFGEFFGVDPTEIPDNAIKLIGEDWMLITAGTKESYNTMTASWGSLGELWYKHIAMCVVRDVRYTYQFMEKESHYTLTFFNDEQRDILKICGSTSGRDTDKAKKAGLTPIVTPTGSISFAEARMIIECRKMYAEPFKESSFVEKADFDKSYTKEKSIHTMYIGEIVNVWVK